MPFDTDQQTLLDLSLTGINGHQAISELFKPVTIGGKIALKELFDHPLNDVDIIVQRQRAIRFLQQEQPKVKLDKEETDFIEHYLNSFNREETFSKIRAYKNQFKNWIKPSSQHYIVSRGVRLLIYQLHHITDTLEAYTNLLPVHIAELQLLSKGLVALIRPLLVFKSKAGRNFNAVELEELDFLFRYSKKHEVKQYLLALYQLDVFMAAAKTGDDLNFCYPEIILSDEPELRLNGFFHPFVKEPVVNNLEFNYQQNLCFITGANMAGKSTLLKSIGICTYLAHLGFPAPAASMYTTVFNGMFTTINLADNIVAGHSHFYSEVLRIKHVALQIGTIKKILILFDELFRGTNVKDAHDASLAIIKAFAQVKTSLFIVSTHIVEVAEELKVQENIFFKCLGTTMQRDKAVYNYQLKDGISNERLGMRIIEDEGLVDIITAQVGN
ncbi:MutS-related protein [Mucilaginibacter boryungensis]